MKTRVFIGSSTESRPIAEMVLNQLSQTYDCIIWCGSSFFDINKQTYETLAKKAIAFDFAVYIGGKDDFVVRTKTKSEKYAPRDNIYLEFGLYAGILSPARSFILLHKECKIASDLSGITVLTFSNEKSVAECCNKIKSAIEQEQEKSRIQLLPSTSLAVGYYYNFLQILSTTLQNINRIKVENRLYSFDLNQIKLDILIPSNINVDWKSWTGNYYRKLGIVNIELPGRPRNFGIVADRKLLKQDHILRLLDVPITLRASFIAVDLVVGKDSIGTDGTEYIAKQKEIDNFCVTLKRLVKKDALLSDILSIQIVD
ncbi:TIR domain-containing protein [uncultured Gemmiger sp.]|uniref:TIR domain-containing protein n=1 Tax=uncultured Gemmiger sp. TaxID=1623490 RepID=UPI0025FBBAE6|nr:TIR domain-containing protein [uncultured Gemmiger sp.]